jgi:hypothetical protein
VFERGPVNSSTTASSLYAGTTSEYVGTGSANPFDAPFPYSHAASFSTALARGLGRSRGLEQYDPVRELVSERAVNRLLKRMSDLMPR